MQAEPEPETPVDIRRLVDLHHTFGEESCNSVGHTRSNSFPWGFTLSPRVAELAEDWLAERESLSPQAHAPGGSSPEAVHPKRQKLDDDAEDHCRDQQRLASNQMAETRQANSDQHSQPHNRGTAVIEEVKRSQATVPSTPSEHQSRLPAVTTGTGSAREKQLEALRQQCSHVSSVNSRLKLCVRTLLAKLDIVESESRQTKQFLAALMVDPTALQRLPQLLQLDAYRKKIALAEPCTAQSVPQPHFQPFQQQQHHQQQQQHQRHWSSPLYGPHTPPRTPKWSPQAQSASSSHSGGKSATLQPNFAAVMCLPPQ